MLGICRHKSNNKVGARYICRKNHWQTKVSASADQEQYASLLISNNLFKKKHVASHLQAWAYNPDLIFGNGPNVRSQNTK